MTEYASIKGTRVKYLSADPTLNDAAKGQVWYNSVSNVLKSFVYFKAFASGGNIPTATNGNASATSGTQTAALSFGGGSTKPQTIEYGGFQWTTSNNLGTPRFVLKGAGTQTAGLGFGGYRDPGGPSNATEEYDGSSWTAGGNLPSARTNMSGNGTQTAALCTGGSPPFLSATEEYDGNSWTSGGAYPIALQDLATAGTQTAAMGAGGMNGPPSSTINVIANYDGSTWTTLANTIPNGQNRSATAGTQTHAVVMGGNTNASGPPNGVVTTASNEFDGSVFSITANMATARQSYGGAGTATAALGFGGDLNPGNSAATEEYNAGYNPGVGPAAWIAITNCPVGLRQGSGGGTPTAWWGASGYGPAGKTPNTVEWDGSSWSEGGNLGTSRYSFAGAGGPQTSAYVAGGTDENNNTQPMAVATEEYNGTSWTGGGTMNGPGRIAGANPIGTQTAGLAAGGGRPHGPDRVAFVEEYNGSSWTNQNSMSTARSNIAGGGIQTSALVFGGNVPPATNASEEYDGTNWTSGGNLPVSRLSMLGSGPNSDNVVGTGGEPPQFQVETFYYNGTAWADTGTDLAAGKGGTASGGLGSGGMIVSGGGSPGGAEVTSTELVTSNPGGAPAASTLTTS